MSTTQPDWPCPGQPSSEFHTNGIDDVGGCALAVAYKSDATQVEPEDFTVFSVNQTCVWYMHTSFQIPAEMPQCPDGKCICAWFWIHRPDSGSEQSGFPFLFWLYWLEDSQVMDECRLHDGLPVQHARCHVDHAAASSSGASSVCTSQ